MKAVGLKVSNKESGSIRTEEVLTGREFGRMGRGYDGLIKNDSFFNVASNAKIRYSSVLITFFSIKFSK